MLLVHRLFPMSEAVSNEIKQLLDTPELAELGPKRRAGTQTEAALSAKLDGLFHQPKLSSTSQQLIRALILLWHDHLDASHDISQSIENPDGSFVHAAMHRREPDYFNSKYWWRRVGQHPVFPEIAERAGNLLKERGAGELAGKLVPNGEWDAFAFVDACEAAARNHSANQRELLRELQRIEFEVLLGHFCQLRDFQ